MHLRGSFKRSLSNQCQSKQWSQIYNEMDYMYTCIHKAIFYAVLVSGYFTYVIGATHASEVLVKELFLPNLNQNIERVEIYLKYSTKWMKVILVIPTFDRSVPHGLVCLFLIRNKI